MLRLVDDLHHKLWRGVVALVIDVEGRRPNLRYGPIWLGLIMMEIRMKLNFILNFNSISILIWKFSISKIKILISDFFFFNFKSKLEKYIAILKILIFDLIYFQSIINIFIRLFGVYVYFFLWK